MSEPLPDGVPVAALGLREDFLVPTLEQWHAECVKLLKGVPFEKKMVTPTYEGITLQPLYTAADTASLEATGGMPGARPFLRGTRPLGYRQQPWQVAQELPYPAYEDFNDALRHDLARGQDTVVLVIDAAGQAGLDPDQAPAAKVGHGGTSVASLRGLRKALERIDLAAHPVHIESGSAALTYAALLVALARERGLDPRRLRGSVGLDPLGGLAQLGQLPLALVRAYDELGLLTRWAADHAPDLRTVAAYGHPYHDAGASAVQELAFTLAAAVNHLRELEERGVAVETAAPRILCGFSVGTHFFMEIAKLRAARVLWSRIIGACGGEEYAQALSLHARTSRFGQTVCDPHVNIVRGTTEAMAAILGGVDSLHVAPFDEALGLPDAFSRRLARNTHTILREESHLDLVVDPAGGTWYVEALTAQVASAAWALFQEVETRGGLVAALKSGWVQSEIGRTAQARREHLACRKDVLVGTTKYANPQERPCVGGSFDHTAFHAQRSRTLQAMRTRSEHAESDAVLRKLDAILASQPAGMFDAIVDAAAQGATVGELCVTFRHDADPQMQVVPLRPLRAAEPFETLRLAVQAYAAQQPAATRVFCANLGDVARYMTRLDFVKGFFQTGGFTVVADRTFQAPAEAAAAAKDDGAATAVIVGLDETYAELAADTAHALKAAGIATVVLAGQPGAIGDVLRGAGVDDFIHVRSDILTTLQHLATSKGVAM